MKTHKQKKDPLGLSWIGAGMIFLFNPLINVVDVLPDFIGLFMIMHGLSKVAEVTDHLGDARDGFAKLAIVSLIQTGIVFTLPFNSDSYTMLMAFSVSIVSAIYFVPAVSHLFEGFSYVSLRTGAASPNAVPSRGALRGKNQKHSSVTALQVLTYAAFFIRAGGAVLPLVPGIFVNDYVGAPGVNWAQYSGVLYAFAWVAGFAVGIPWLLRFRRYIKGMCADPVLTETLWQRYKEEVLPNKGYLAAKRTRILLILTIVACGLTFCMYVDYVNIVPNAFSAAFLIAVFAFLKREDKKHALWGIVLSVLLIIASIVTEVLLVNYTGGINNYTPASFAIGVQRARELYPWIMVFSLIEAVLALAAFAVLLYLLRGLLRSHIAAYAGRFYRTEEQAAAEIARLTGEVQNRLRFAAVAGGAALLLNGVYACVAPWAPVIWILNAMVVALFTYGMYKVYAYMQENLYTRILRNY